MILLDTHIWVNWILKGDAALPTAVVDAMQEELFGGIDHFLF